MASAWEGRARRVLGTEHIIDDNRGDFDAGPHRFDLTLDIGDNSPLPAPAPALSSATRPRGTPSPRRIARMRASQVHSECALGKRPDESTAPSDVEAINPSAAQRECHIEDDVGIAVAWLAGSRAIPHRVFRL